MVSVAKLGTSTVKANLSMIKNAEERVALVEKIYILYPRLKEIVARMTYCQEYSKCASEPICFFISGPSGVGKTKLIQHYADLYGRRADDEKSVVPVLTCTTPVPATVTNLVTALLHQVGDRMSMRGSIAGRTLRLYELLKRCNVELLILDEFQHFIDRESLRVLVTVSDWLKNFISETGLPMVLVGLPYAERVLEANVQLARRFSSRTALEPFSCKTQEKWDEFRTFLSMVDAMLPLQEKSHLADEWIACRLFYASGGLASSVMRLVKRAAVRAIETSADSVSLEALSEAYREELQPNHPKRVDPFRIDNVAGDLELMEEEILKRSNLSAAVGARQTMAGKRKKEKVGEILNLGRD